MSKQAQDLLNWFSENKFENISDTGLTWREVGEQFGLSSEQARYAWRKDRRKKENLILKSRWQVQRKGGAVEWLESYYNPNERLSEYEIKEVLEGVKIEPYFKEGFQLDKTPSTYAPSLILYISDQHIGARNEDKGLYDNPYDQKELEKRLQLIIDKVLELQISLGNFNDIIVCFLGDSIDSYNKQTSRGGHELPSNMDNKEMFDCFIQTHSKFLLTLIEAKITDNVTVYATANSNHPGDIEYMAMQALKYFCKAHNMPVTFNVVEKFLDHFIIGEDAFIISHGKDKQYRKSGLPKNINPATELYLEQYIRHHKLTEYNCHFIKGDLHIQNSEMSKFFRYRNVGSVFGASDWIMHNFGKTTAGADYDLIIPTIGILEGKIKLQ
jgi:hypothetical protein